MFKNMSLRAKIMGGSSIPLVLFVVLGSATVSWLLRDLSLSGLHAEMRIARATGNKAKDKNRQFERREHEIVDLVKVVGVVVGMVLNSPPGWDQLF
ncbi:MAG: hypothetical protein IH986_04775 [Planctomycetes bacterium]|nr:hypothetical protein [Planctomycetota bacterium]